MKAGTQIIYVPLHANGDIEHDDAQRGFVVSEAGPDAHFCRYWQQGTWGALRTTVNSERTPNDCLVDCDSGPQRVVDACLAEIRRETASIA